LRADAGTLRLNQGWEKVLGKKAMVVVLTFGIIVHGIPIKSFEPNKQEDMITRLEADNALNIPQLDVAYMGWLNRPQKGKSHGSIVVKFRSLI
jgi:hypothetical protein